jgi:hypothetical protein
MSTLCDSLIAHFTHPFPTCANPLAPASQVNSLVQTVLILLWSKSWEPLTVPLGNRSSAS